jgi:hypothetical protein
MIQLFDGRRICDELNLKIGLREGKLVPDKGMESNG